MNRANFTVTLVIFALFLGIIVDGSLVQGETGTFSGRVVDFEGNPVADLPIFVGPAGMEHALDWPSAAFFPGDYPRLHRARTDSAGRFSITGIPSGAVYFGALPHNIASRLPLHLQEMSAAEVDALFTSAFETDSLEALVSSSFGMENTDFEPDVEVLSIRIRGISCYPHADGEEIVFEIRPGMHLEDAVVTVQPRMRIRGKILFKDGTPLANARIRLNVRSRDADGKGSGNSVSTSWTDAEGYFVHYLEEKDDDAFYTVGAAYKALEVESEPVLLKPGERYESLVLTFNSEPLAAEEAVQLKTASPVADAPAPKPRLRSDEVWMGNPANGHVYKRIRCATRDEALAIAAAEDAQLVSINDEAEQQWVSAVFRGDFYWIGLSRTAAGWQWSDGEPGTYENWLPADFFSESIEPGKHTAAIMTIEDGKWYAVNADSVITNFTKWAILEKAEPVQTPRK